MVSTGIVGRIQIVITPTLCSPKSCRYQSQFLSSKLKQRALYPLVRVQKWRNTKSRSSHVVFAQQFNFLKVIQTVWKVGNDAIGAGTSVVPVSNTFLFVQGNPTPGAQARPKISLYMCVKNGSIAHVHGEISSGGCAPGMRSHFSFYSTIHLVNILDNSVHNHIAVSSSSSFDKALIPRPIARVAVTIAAVAAALFVVKSFLSTAFFALAVMGLSYFTFIALNKDEGPKGDGGSGTTSVEDSLEEARRIMDKYK